MRYYTRLFPALEQFLSGYFYHGWQESYDWQDQAPNFEAVVYFFKFSTVPSEITQVIKELQQFLALPLSDEQLVEIVNYEFAVSYTPRSRGLTKRQWLEAMVPILQEPVRPSSLRFKT